MENQANTTEVVTEVVTVKAKPGRPVNETSKRQQVIKARQEAKANGTFKKGRPVVEGSKRQELLKKREEKVAELGELKKGRPTVAGSKRQELLKAKAEKLAAGITPKRGRPKMEKVEVVVEAPVVEEVKVEEIVMETGDTIIETLKKDKRKSKKK